MVGGQRLQMEPTKELTPLEHTPTYSDTLVPEIFSSYTDCNSIASDSLSTLDNLTGNDFLADANFSDALYPCDEAMVDIESWDLSSLLTAV